MVKPSVMLLLGASSAVQACTAPVANEATVEFVAGFEGFRDYVCEHIPSCKRLDPRKRHANTLTQTVTLEMASKLLAMVIFARSPTAPRCHTSSLLCPSLTA